MTQSEAERHAELLVRRNVPKEHTHQTRTAMFAWVQPFIEIVGRQLRTAALNNSPDQRVQDAIMRLRAAIFDLETHPQETPLLGAWLQALEWSTGLKNSQLQTYLDLLAEEAKPR